MARRTGIVLSALAVLFLVMDSVGKLLAVQPVVDGTVALGYPASAVRTLGVLLLACVVLYVVPRTTMLGAVLLTGYLGGAVATHFRIGNPLFTHMLFPVYLGAFLWIGLALRDPRVRRVFLER